MECLAGVSFDEISSGDVMEVEQLPIKNWSANECLMHSCGFFFFPSGNISSVSKLIIVAN